MKCTKLWHLVALVALAMLPLAGCSGGNGSNPISADKQTVKMDFAGNVEVPKTGKAVAATAGALGKVEVFNAYSSANKAALGTAEVQADGSFSGLKFELPTTKSVVVFKATLTGSTLRTVVPMDLSAPPTGLMNNNVNIIIDTNSTDIAAKVATELGLASGKLLGDTLVSPSKDWTTFAQSVAKNGGQVLSFNNNGFSMTGSVRLPEVAVDNEACVVCHKPNDLADVEAVHNFVYDPATGTRTLKPRTPETGLVISNVAIASEAVTDKPVITFTVKQGSKAPAVFTGADVSLYIADIVPAGKTSVKTGKSYVTSYPQTYIYGIKGNVTGGGWTYNSTTGVAKVTLPTAFGVVSGSANTSVADFVRTDVQRLWINVRPSVGNTSMLANESVVTLSASNSITDFKINAVGDVATLFDAPQNQVVTLEACQKCHGAPMIATAHGSFRKEPLACEMCHSPVTGTDAFNVPLTSLIHEIHAAKDLKDFNTRILGSGYTDVTYPQPLTNCTACHSNPSGKSLGATGNKLENWKSNPSAIACLTCHDKGTTKTAHTDGIADAQCNLCHTAAQITAKHTKAPAAKDVPEYTATMTIDAPANGTHYVKGEAPTITVTLKDDKGAAVPAAFYTAKSHKAGLTDAGSLSNAALYVYGPRANAKPVLTKGAVTLSAAGVPTQKNSMLLPSTDTQVLTDATGFKYKLSAIPEISTSATFPDGKFKPGTYMIRFIAQNYGYVSDTDYKIDTIAFKTIQIGQAAVEAKIAGDACVDCHGDGNFEGHNARHSVIWNTDHCISCHDKSGNYAINIANRVHAVHSASKTGDAYGSARNWSKISFPQGLQGRSYLRDADGKVVDYVVTAAGAPRCIGCHTGTAGTGVAWKTSVSTWACIACHSDKPKAIQHFQQMGAKSSNSSH